MSSVDIKVASKWTGMILVFVTTSGGAGFGGSYLQSRNMEAVRVGQAVMDSEIEQLTIVVKDGFATLAEDSKAFRDVQGKLSTDVATLLAGQEELKRRMILVENRAFGNP